MLYSHYLSNVRTYSSFYYVFSVEITYGRDLRRDLRDITDLRESDSTPGLLLSALCVQDGQLRKSCLEGNKKKQQKNKQTKKQKKQQVYL
jgi:hypothetical protein